MTSNLQESDSNALGRMRLDALVSEISGRDTS
jgi:hypothetical protein